MPEATPPDLSALLAGRRRILVTGGAGFNCCAEAKGYGGGNLDKLGYASDLSSVEALPQAAEGHTLLRVDLTDAAATAAAVRQADPDLVMHLAAESHVVRSIEGPAAYGSTSSPDCVYIDSNVTGTFHLLQAVRSHWEALPAERADGFRSSTSPPMRCSAHWAQRAASRIPPPATRAAPTPPARPPAITR